MQEKTLLPLFLHSSKWKRTQPERYLATAGRAAAANGCAENHAVLHLAVTAGRAAAANGSVGNHAAHVLHLAVTAERAAVTNGCAGNQLCCIWLYFWAVAVADGCTEGRAVLRFLEMHPNECLPPVICVTCAEADVGDVLV